MMRSLWTAASGMIAQQQNVDTISNNLANVNTTGYKKETVSATAKNFNTILFFRFMLPPDPVFFLFRKFP